MTSCMNARTQGKRSRNGAREIVHELRNYMSVLLLNLENVEADSGHISCDSPTVENTIAKMNCLLEELARLLGERHQRKNPAASKTRAIVSAFRTRSLTGVG